MRAPTLAGEDGEALAHAAAAVGPALPCPSPSPHTHHSCRHYFTSRFNREGDLMFSCGKVRYRRARKRERRGMRVRDCEQKSENSDRPATLSRPCGLDGGIRHVRRRPPARAHALALAHANHAEREIIATHPAEKRKIIANTLMTTFSLIPCISLFHTSTGPQPQRLVHRGRQAPGQLHRPQRRGGHVRRLLRLVPPPHGLRRLVGQTVGCEDRCLPVHLVL